MEIRPDGEHPRRAASAGTTASAIRSVRHLPPAADDADRRVGVQRAVARSERPAAPASRRTSGQRVKAPADDHKGEPLAGDVEERLRHAGRLAAGRPHEGDLARRLEARHTRGGERARRERGLDRGARDEGDAVPAWTARVPTPGGRAPAGRRGPSAACRASQLVLDHLPHARALLHEDERLRAQLVERDGLTGEAVVGRAGEDDLVAEERLERDASDAAERRRRCRARARGSATSSTTVCVSETRERDAHAGCARWNSQSSSGTTVPPGPVDAPSSSVP